MVWRRARTDGSYLSSSDPRVHFGLGGADEPLTVVVEWPRGSREAWAGVRPDQLVLLAQGTGAPRPRHGPAKGPGYR